MNGYDLTRCWYNFKFDNPKKVKSVHSDLFFYIIDLWNRLGQKKEFGLPTSVTMESLGIGSYNTFKKTLDDLFDFGFIKLISDSKNQHQSKVIAISKIDKASDKALDKATIKATDKPTDTILITNVIKNKEQINKEQYILKNILNPHWQSLISENNLEINDFYFLLKEINEKRKKVPPKKEKVFGKDDFRESLLNLGSDPKHVDDWLKVRSDKKASFTETAYNGFVNECKKHNFPIKEAVRLCAERSWQGFKYQWILNDLNNGKSTFNNGSNSGYKPAKTDSEKLIRELESDFKNGNIPGVY